MKTKSILIVACIGMMFAACSSDETPTQNAGGIPINFTANIQNLITSVGTRVTGETGMVTTEFPTGSEIKVGFVDDYFGNDSYITNSSGSWTYTSTSTKKYLPYNAASKQIAALYPAPSHSIFEMTSYRYSWTISSDQSSIDGYKSSDLLGAVATVTKENANAVVLSFKHLGSKVIVNVKDGTSNVSGYNITMKSIVKDLPLGTDDNGFLFDFTSYSPIKGPVIFGESSSTEGQAAIIIPQTIAQDVELFEVTKDGVTYTFTTTERITFKSGYSYTFDLKFENTEIGMGNVTISKDWEPDPDKPTIEGNLKQQTTT